MRDILRYKLAVIRQNKAYAIALAILFVVLFVFFLLVFALPRGSVPLGQNLEESLIHYQTILDGLRQDYQNGLIGKSKFESEKAVYEFFLTTQTADWMYLKFGSNIAGKEFACGCYTFAMRLFPLICCVFGIMGGNFAFTSDFSSDRVKNIWSVKRRKGTLFSRFYALFLALFAGFASLFFFFLLFGSSSIWGERMYSQIGNAIHCHFVMENLFSLFLFCLSECIFFFSLSSAIGMFSKSLIVGAIGPLLILAICVAEGFFFSGAEAPGLGGWQISVIPFASLAYLPQYGTSPWLFLWSGIYILLGILFYALGRNAYAKKAI